MVSEIDRLDVDYSNISGCISNPPYNIKWQHPMFAAFDNRFAEYGVPPENNANYAFMLNALNKAERKALDKENTRRRTENTAGFDASRHWEYRRKRK